MSVPAPLDVTVYVPCYNVARFLPRVLDGLLRQTHPVRRILVIDDGSTDDTAAIAERAGVGVIRHPRNLGLAAARNTALRAAQTEWVASVDGDVVAHADWLQRLVEVVRSGPYAGAGGLLQETQLDTLGDLWRCAHMRQSWGPQRLEDPEFLFGANTLLRRADVLAAGLYDEAKRTNGEDKDLSLRLKARGARLVYDPGPRCDHLRSDTLRSIWWTFWRWHHPDGPPRGLAAWRGKAGHLTRSVWWPVIRRDAAAGRHALVLIDVGMWALTLLHDLIRALRPGPAAR